MFEGSGGVGSASGVHSNLERDVALPIRFGISFRDLGNEGREDDDTSRARGCETEVWMERNDDSQRDETRDASRGHGRKWEV